LPHANASRNQKWLKDYPSKGKGQSDFSDWPLFNAGNDRILS